MNRDVLGKSLMGAVFLVPFSHTGMLLGPGTLPSQEVNAAKLKFGYLLLKSQNSGASVGREESNLIQKS